MRIKGFYLYLMLVATLLGGLVLAACGDGDEEGAENAPAARDTAVAEATAAPEEAENGEAEPTATEAAEEPEDGEEITPPADAFAELDSYRFSLTLSFESTDLTEQGFGSLSFDLSGAFVAPDRSEMHVEGDLGGFALEEDTITIGARTWVRSGNTWQEGESTFDATDLAPSSFFSTFDPENLTIIEPTEETANGVDSFRYSIDEADIEQLQALGAIFGGGDGLEELPEDLSLDLWLAKDGGWPVKMLMQASGPADGGVLDVEMSMDITDVDDPDIEIEPPI